MKIRVVAPVHDLEFENLETFVLGDFLLTNNFDIKNSILLSRNFQSRIGSNRVNILMRGYIMYFCGESTSINILKDLTDEATIANTISSFLRLGIQCLWHVKDNGTYLNQCYIEFNDETIYETHTVGMASNSEGDHKTTSYSFQELIDGFTLMTKLLKFQKIESKQVSDTSLLVPRNGIHILNNVNYASYIHSRLFRCLSFLDFVRKSDNLIVKITFYVAMFECLFTSNGSEITHQVSERAALYIGGDLNTKRANYDLIKSAYNIRSRYIHGSNINKQRSELLVLSSTIDILTRGLLHKIFLDSDLFLATETEANNKRFENFFKDLIFN